MIVTRLKLPLDQIEYTALLKMAGNELRSPTDQVRVILRLELERQGFLCSQDENVGGALASGCKTAKVQDGQSG